MLFSNWKYLLIHHHKNIYHCSIWSHGTDRAQEIINSQCFLNLQVIGIAFMTTGTAMIIKEGDYNFSFDVFSEMYSMNFIFILGCLIFIASWIGCFSALRESHFLLNIYAGIVMLQLFVQISLLLSALYYRTEICEHIADEYKKLFLSRDKGLNGQFLALIERHVGYSKLHMYWITYAYQYSISVQLLWLSRSRKLSAAITSTELWYRTKRLRRDYKHLYHWKL